MKWLKRLWKNSKGQSLVEFALTVLLMVTILLGTIDMGFMFTHQYGLSSIAKDTARAVSVGKSSYEIERIVRADAQMIFTPVSVSSSGSSIVIEGSNGYRIDVRISPGIHQRKKGETVEVTVDYTYRPIAFFLPETISMGAKGYTLIEESQ